MSESFERTLIRLRELANEFAAHNPTLAPYLGTQAASDPDVERLFEGVAYLTSLVERRLDDDFPEFIQTLAHLLFPQVLQPMPCATMVRFEPKGVLGAVAQVDAGVQLASIPVDGTRVLFRTTRALSVEPITLLGVRWEMNDGVPHALRLDFSIDGVAPNEWTANRVLFHLSGSLSEASRLMLLLARHVKQVQIGGSSGESVSLPPRVVSLPAFCAEASLLPQPANALPGLSLMRDYFALPERFLFVAVDGLRRWRERAEDGRFYIRFVLGEVPDWAHTMHEPSVMLNVTPAINLFEAQAHPVALDDLHAEYLVHVASAQAQRQTTLFCVEDVRGYANGKEVVFAPFGTFCADRPSYHVRLRPSVVPGRHDGYLGFPSVQDISGLASQGMNLSVSALCTHGTLAESLRTGELNQASDSSPARMTFSNISAMTPYRAPTLDDTLLWRLLSHMHGGYARMGDAAQFKQLLRLHMPTSRGGSIEAAQRRMIDAIERVELRPACRLMRGLPVEGTEMHITCRSDAFVHLGGMFLFGSVIDEYLAGSCALNTFTELTMTDSVHGQSLYWPPKIGHQRLL
ncbi:type VI secretion protein ImpG [Pandoraea iniqua]|uniref:Type VI secretion protein ImpG n=1 Tax=Pandoraea iniqua TaxID=2508288 RepID=A0A5E4YD24_9BURK|nr:type VI secretion system baseplate subunit TssF [Pandoraea iniqua]VVE46646.1 type VI secretion protein ImpG [Pandoraea iniqua]